MSYPELLTPAEKLAAGKIGLNIPSIVVICGSTRFMDVMTDVDRALTWAGSIVVKPGCDMKTPHPLWADPREADAGKERLDGLHRAKIRLADRVYVVCPGGYIGDSTRAEIAYAESLGLPVHYVADGDLIPVTVDGSEASENTCERCGQPSPEGKTYCSDRCRWDADDHGPDREDTDGGES